MGTQLENGGADSPDHGGQHRTEPYRRHHLHLHGQPISWDKCVVAEVVAECARETKGPAGR